MEKQMEMDKAQFAEQLKNLVELGKKKKNVLEYQEINDFFKGITLNNEQMDLIFEYLEANGVTERTRPERKNAESMLRASFFPI